MPKYVCDFETVKQIGSDLVKAADSINTSVTNYATNIEGNLSDWTSSAKNSFVSVNSVQVATTTSNVEYTTKLGEFIQLAAESIEKVDEGLASSIKI